MNRITLGLGVVIGVAQLGILGVLLTQKDMPILNLPVGDYTSYSVEASRDGYKIDYSANDPKTMIRTKNLDKKNGFFGIGGKTQLRTTTETYVLGGEDEKKLDAKTVSCIEAAGGGRSQGKLVGASIGTAAAPWFISIPYIGPALGGFVAMFAMDKGGEVGAEMATTLEDCEDIEDR